MKELIKKIGGLVQPISNEKGELSFFGLVLREDASVWDLLVAAKWIDEDRKQALNYLVKQVQHVLTKQDLLDISGIFCCRTNILRVILSLLVKQAGKKPTLTYTE